MPAYRPARVVLAERLLEAPAPSITDRLGRPLIGPCLIWTGALDGKGYGAMGNKDFGTSAIQRTHRVAYAISNGIPLDQIRTIPELDHLCRVTSCCQASHLEPVSHGENIRRGDVNAAKRNSLGCIRGHPWTPENTAYRSGGRQCRTCHRERSRARYSAARRAERYQAKKAATVRTDQPPAPTSALRQ